MDERKILKQISEILHVEEKDIPKTLEKMRKESIQ